MGLVGYLFRTLGYEPTGELRTLQAQRRKIVGHLGIEPPTDVEYGLVDTFLSFLGYVHRDTGLQYRRENRRLKNNAGKKSKESITPVQRRRKKRPNLALTNNQGPSQTPSISRYDFGQQDAADESEILEQPAYGMMPLLVGQNNSSANPALDQGSSQQPETDYADKNAANSVGFNVASQKHGVPWRSLTRLSQSGAEEPVPAKPTYDRQLYTGPKYSAGSLDTRKKLIYALQEMGDIEFREGGRRHNMQIRRRGMQWMPLIDSTQAVHPKWYVIKLFKQLGIYDRLL